MRRCGLTVDNLLAVDLVTAEGEKIRVDAQTSNAHDLWIGSGGRTFPGD